MEPPGGSFHSVWGTNNTKLLDSFQKTPEVDSLTNQLGNLRLDKSLEKKEEGIFSPSISENPKSCAKYKVVTNVHRDDIHGLLKLGDGSFISGSKDCSIKKWGFEGKLIKQVYEPNYTDYTQWITALGLTKDGHWISGTRDGLVDLWDIHGNWEKTLIKPQEQEANTNYKCKERNINRVLHISQLPSSNEFLVGRPTQFSVHKNTTGQTLCHHLASKNDWVYVTHLLPSETGLLVVTGPNLDLWERPSSHSYDWKQKLSLVKEEPNNRIKRQRLFISAITPLLSEASHFGLSIFDGRVKIFDITAQKTVWEAEEHKDRVWTIENITPTCFASCADDGMIKLWDTRIPKSFLSLKDNEKEKARVSVLMKITDTTFLSGSCPDDVRKSAQKAQFSFWDIRKG